MDDDSERDFVNSGRYGDEEIPDAARVEEGASPVRDPILRDVADEDLPKSPLISISIRNPEKRGDGISSFVVYTIVSTREDEKENAAVERRFSDFVWLRDQLRKEKKGIIIPPLPEKKLGVELSL